jgi:hypothetical protein
VTARPGVSVIVPHALRFSASDRHIVLGLISDDWREQCDLLAEAVALI